MDRSERGDGEATAPTLRGVLAIVLTGAALGVVYNASGLRQQRWGLPWVAQDRRAAMEELAPIAAADGSGGSGYGALDDPMAVTAAAGVPEVPELDRPVQVRIDAVKQFVDAGAALVVDARTPEEYRDGHLPGAVNLPYDEVSSDPRRLEELETGGRPIIVYCGGGDCELSMNLAFDLVFAGHPRVLVYMGGYPEWEQAGHPVRRSPGAR